jgi:uncharacterized alkaline shock family protein YloU
MSKDDNRDLEAIPNNPGENIGKTTISPEVLITIARLTTLEVEGVSRMSNLPAGFNRLFKRKYGEGVRLSIDDDTVTADLFIILKNGVNIREVSRMVQNDVTRAVTEMVGMDVGSVNIHIEDIDFPEKHPRPGDGNDST